MNEFKKLFMREEDFFSFDVMQKEQELREAINRGSFLIIGAAGSIGSAVASEIISRNPRKLDLVDINENELAETIRQFRNKNRRIKTEINILVADYGSQYFMNFIENMNYDYVLNLSALKHVRSEANIISIKRMFDVNVVNNLSLMNKIGNKIKKFFCVSTDKATSPVNLMGASKRLMEILISSSPAIENSSSARFANVAFSNGSLLQSFQNRLIHGQPIACPSNIKRYFISKKEAGQLCMLSTIFGKNDEIYIPKLTPDDQYLLSDLAEEFVRSNGYMPKLFFNEKEAFLAIKKISKKEWPIFISEPDTTGEKEEEKFSEDAEKLINNIYKNISVINLTGKVNAQLVEEIDKELKALNQSNSTKKTDFIALVNKIIPNFNHLEKNKSLNDKI